MLVVQSYYLAALAPRELAVRRLAAPHPRPTSRCAHVGCRSSGGRSVLQHLFRTPFTVLPHADHLRKVTQNCYTRRVCSTVQSPNRRTQISIAPRGSGGPGMSAPGAGGETPLFPMASVSGGVDARGAEGSLIGFLPSACPSSVVAQPPARFAAVAVLSVTAVPLADTGTAWIVGASLQCSIDTGL